MANNVYAVRDGLSGARAPTLRELKQAAVKSTSGWRKLLGELGEKLVAERLISQGWQIHERNWRAGRYGELDLIASDRSKTLVFVEIKTRCQFKEKAGFPDPGFQSMTRAKQHKIVTAAMIYQARLRLPSPPVRFDAALVVFDLSSMNADTALDSPEIIYVQAVFQSR